MLFLSFRLEGQLTLDLVRSNDIPVLRTFFPGESTLMSLETLLFFHSRVSSAIQLCQTTVRVRSRLTVVYRPKQREENKQNGGALACFARKNNKLF